MSLFCTHGLQLVWYSFCTLLLQNRPSPLGLMTVLLVTVHASCPVRGVVTGDGVVTESATTRLGLLTHSEIRTRRNG